MDYLFHFQDEAAATADPVIGAYWQDNGDGTGQWRGDVCIPNVQVWQVTGNTTDADGNVVETREYVAGWFIRIGDANPDLAAQAYALPEGFISAPVFQA